MTEKEEKESITSKKTISDMLTGDDEHIKLLELYANRNPVIKPVFLYTRIFNEHDCQMGMDPYPKLDLNKMKEEDIKYLEKEGIVKIIRSKEDDEIGNNSSDK